MSDVYGTPRGVSIAGRQFLFDGEASPKQGLGGYKVEVKPNGDGKTARYIQTPTSWSLKDCALVINQSSDDQEYLQGVADMAKKEPSGGVDIVWTAITGVAYQAVGTITDEIIFDLKEGTASVSFGGQGKATKQ